MEEKRFIGFDLGAESGRCVVASVQDARVTLTEVHRFPTHQVKHGRGLHWDLRAISREIIEGLARAGKAFGRRFEGIGVDTWGVDYVLLDGPPVLPVADGRILASQADGTWTSEITLARELLERGTYSGLEEAVAFEMAKTMFTDS